MSEQCGKTSAPVDRGEFKRPEEPECGGRYRFEQRSLLRFETNPSLNFPSAIRHYSRIFEVGMERRQEFYKVRGLHQHFEEFGNQHGLQTRKIGKRTFHPQKNHESVKSWRPSI